MANPSTGVVEFPDLEPNPDRVEIRSDPSSPPSSRRHERSGYVFYSIAKTPCSLFMLAFLIPYLTVLAKYAVDSRGRMAYIGILPTSFSTVVLIMASLVSAICSPIVGALADFSPHRRSLLKVMTYSVGFSFCAVIVVVRDLWMLGGLLLFIIFCASQSSDFLANSYLPELGNSPDKRSAISERAVRYGLLAQIVLLTVASATTYLLGAEQLSVMGGQIDSEVSAQHFRSRSFTTLEEAEAHLAKSRTDILQQWSQCGSDGTYPCEIHSFKTAQFLKKRSAVVSGRDGELSYLVLQEKASHVALSNKEFTINIVAHSRAVSSKVRILVYAYDDNGLKGVRVAAGEPVSIRSDGEDQLLRLTGNLPAALHYVLYVIEVSTPGAVKIKRVDALNTPDFVVPVLCLSLGIWCLVWSYIGLNRLGQRIPKDGDNHRFVLRSFIGLGRTIRRTCHDSVLSRNLIATAFYCAGVGSVMAMGATFVTEQLGLSSMHICLAMLGNIAFSIFGAFLFLRLGSQIGYSRALSLSYALWVVNILLMFFLLLGKSDRPWLFLTVPIMGTATGGCLALSRAVFASMVPVGRECELFGLNSFCQVILAPIGLLVFMMANEIMGCLRWGILSQAVFTSIAALIQASIKESDIEARSSIRLARAHDDDHEISGHDDGSSCLPICF